MVVEPMCAYNHRPCNSWLADLAPGCATSIVVRSPPLCLSCIPALVELSFSIFFQIFLARCISRSVGAGAAVASFSRLGDNMICIIIFRLLVGWIIIIITSHYTTLERAKQNLVCVLCIAYSSAYYVFGLRTHPVQGLIRCTHWASLFICLRTWLPCIRSFKYYM